MPRRSARLVAPAVAALLPAAAAAQAPGTPRDSATRRIEPVVVTGTRAAATVGGAGAVVVRPDSLPIPTQPAPLLEQVLRQTPFVLVRQNSRGEVELSVRGSDSRQASLLLDGLPLTLGWDHRTDASLIPATGVRRVTLVRGLSSLLTGPNALGGVIAVELNAADADGARRPDLTLGTGIDQFSARVLTAAGGAPVALGSGTLTFRGGATYRQRDGFALSRDGGAGEGTTGGVGDPGDVRDAALRTNTDLRQTDGFAAVRWDGASGAYLGGTVTAYDARRGVAPELHVRAPRFWRYPESSRRLGVLSAGTGDLATPFGRGRVDASVGAYQGDLEIESFTNRTYSTVASRELGDERTASGRVTAAHSLPGDGQLRVGGTLADVRYDETLDAQLPASVASRYRQRLSSLGAELEFPLLSRVLVSGGVVRDAAETPETGGKASLGELSRWGWRVGTTAAVVDQLRLHASASRRARFPALRELYSGALNRFDPNPTLRPESLLGFEAGATVVGDAAARAGLTLQTVAFHHRLDDAVVRVTLPNRLFRRVNRDQIRSTGVELLAGWTPASLRGVSFTGDLLAQKVRLYDETLPAGQPNERRPEHQPQLRGSFDVGVPLGLGVRGSALARYTGRQFCQHPDLGRQVALGAQTVGDAALSRAWSLAPAGRGARLLRALRATLAMDNVTDATVYDQCGLPQPGRTVRFGLELR
ncbi:TonB-dependent receptor [Roseisolibacter sp. H3M3-2]|uniref:TonB-dependent receptor plug domain-containing protein n=1 Tax=Roseisolibacter sp. H3M3-2 TaxID=3031323 RepID=UPI0023DCB482|nr:TonB-dependent receptor [Roseisolibacter sp. H3M3-2]MDF1504397.1 TonB-dependent receptor [Roseisolibacter sp. H3M3-2]